MPSLRDLCAVSLIPVDLPCITASGRVSNVRQDYALTVIKSAASKFPTGNVGSMPCHHVRNAWTFDNLDSTNPIDSNDKIVLLSSVLLATDKKNAALAVVNREH